MLRLKNLFTIDKTTLGASAFVLLTALALSTAYYLSATENGLLDIRRQAFGEPTAGYSSLINASYYGMSSEGLDDLQRAAAAPSGGENELTVQDVQPPSISGFSTDAFTGNVTVGFPFSTPPGRGGLTPQLSLTYSSGSVYDSLYAADYTGAPGGPRDLPDGQHTKEDVEWWKNNTLSQTSQVGLGWNLSGLGKVFRDSNGRYSLVLGGRFYRLYKKDGSQNLWRTEPESFLKIEHQVIANEEPGGEGEKADKWTVYDTGGTRYDFSPRGFIWKHCEARGGESQCIQESSGDVFAASWNNWPLNKVTDTHGNQIDVHYTDERKELACGDVLKNNYPRAIYPTQVLYSGAGDDEAGFLARLVLNYQSRGDTAVRDWDNRCAQVFWADKRLSAVEAQVKDTSSQWQTVRSYLLDNNDYFTAENKAGQNIHLKLNSVTTSGRENMSLPAYSFSYYEDTADQGASFALNSDRLLKSANNGYGGQVEYVYEQYQTPVFLNRDRDFGVYKGEIKETHRVKSKVVADQVTGKTYTTAFEYENPKGLVVNSQLTGFESVGHQQVKSRLEDVSEATSNFVQGEVQAGNFYPSPARGRLAESRVLDIAQNKILSESASDYQIKPEITDWTDWDTVWKTSHFVFPAQSRSCQDPQSSTPRGSLTKYRYEEVDQNGQQFGNLTHSTEYLVDDCSFETAQAYRQTHQTYFPNLDSWITGNVAGQEVYACNTALSGTGSLSECPAARRLSIVWNIYDGDHTKTPWSPPGSKGELKLTRKFVEFPENVFGDAREFIQQAAWRTIDSKIEYDAVGNVTEASSFADYGIVQNQSASSFAWAFSEPGNGSGARTARTTYDPYYQSFALQTTNPLGHRAATSYNHEHPYLSDRIFVQNENDIKNNVGQTTVLDGLSRPIEILDQTGERTTIQYAAAPPYYVYTQTPDDHDNFHSWQFYGGLGQSIQSQSERMGNGAQIYITDTEYNSQGLVAQTSFPREGTRGGILQPQDFSDWSGKTAYDALGRALTSQQPNESGAGPRLVTITYQGRITTTTDARGNQKTSKTDGLGRLAEVKNPLATTKYEYDYLDRLVKTIDNRGNESVVTYNNLGQKTAINDPDLGAWSYEFYPTGELEKITDAKGQVRAFDYDVLGRMRRKYWGERGENLVATFDYDDPTVNGVGRRTKLTDDQSAFNGYTGAVSFVYDIKGRLTSEQKVINFEGEAHDYTTAFEYDSADRIKKIHYPGSDEVVEQKYDEAGRLASVTGDQTYLSSTAYNETGLPKSEVLGNQTVNEYTYEPQTKRLDTITVKNPSGQSLLSFDYAYDPVDNITSIGHSGSATSERALNFVYDELSRLTRFNTTGANVPKEDVLSGEYRYDELGRMEFKREEAAAEPPSGVVQHFKARAVGDDMVVSFALADESGVATFRLERRRNEGTTFETVAENISAGQESYSQTDAGERAGFGSCYRLTAMSQDGTTRGYPLILAGDTGAEPDGKIDLFDLVRVARQWGTSANDGDFDADVDIVENGVIDLFDLVWTARSWGMSCQ